MPSAADVIPVYASLPLLRVASGILFVPKPR